jgi:hypothetical protein
MVKFRSRNWYSANWCLAYLAALREGRKVVWCDLKGGNTNPLNKGVKGEQLCLL